MKAKYQIVMSLVEDGINAVKNIKGLEDKVNHAMEDGYEPIGGLSVVIGGNSKMVLMQAVTLPMSVSQQNTVQNTVVFNKNKQIQKRHRLENLSKVSERNVV